MILAFTILAAACLAHAQEGAPARQKSPSAGEIALMVRRADDPQVIEAWRSALRTGGAHERAAAARMAHVNRVAALAGDLGACLRTETDYQAALEEAAALAGVTGADQDMLLLEAGHRMGERALAEVALILARARRTAAIPAYLDKVKAALVAGSDLTTFFRLATLKDPSALAPVAAAALESGDVDVWLAALDVSLGSGTLLDAGLLGSALRHSSAQIFGGTAWRLATDFARKPPSRPSDRLSGIDAAINEQKSMTSDVDLAIGIELLARVLGREPIENKVWIEYMQGTTESRLDDLDMLRSVVRYLTSGERKVLKKRFKRIYPSLRFPEAARTPPVLKKALTAPKKPLGIVRMANGFPPALVSDTVAASGCSLEAGPLLGEAEVAFDVLGRPTKVTLLRTPESAKCAEAVTTLFSSTLKPISDFSGTENAQTLFLLLEKGYLSRLEEGAGIYTEAVYLPPDTTGPKRVDPPVRVHFVKPVYPASAQVRGIVGKVIVEAVVNPAGLISDIRLLKGDEEELVPPTFMSVAQWRYTPAKEDGQPVRVYLTIIVGFALN